MRPAASWSDLDPAAAVAALLEARAAGVEKRAAIDGAAFLDQLKGYGGRGLAAARDYGGRGAAALQEGLTSGDDRTRLLYGGLAGAGLGALGGGLAGATGPRKKSPWTTALSGALAGGALGGGLAYGLPALQRGMTEPAAPPGTDEEKRKAFEAMGTVPKLIAKANGDPAAAGRSYPALLGQGARNLISTVGPPTTASRIGTTGGAIAGIYAGGRAHGYRLNDERGQMFRAGARVLPNDAPADVRAAIEAMNPSTASNARVGKAVDTRLRALNADVASLAVPERTVGGSHSVMDRATRWMGGAVRPEANAGLASELRRVKLKTNPGFAFPMNPAQRSLLSEGLTRQVRPLANTLNAGRTAVPVPGPIGNLVRGAKYRGVGGLIGGLIGGGLPAAGDFLQNAVYPQE